MEHDPVVKEIPVFVSKNLSDDLYIVQFPICPLEDKYENATFVRSFIKPKMPEIRMEFGINTNSINYDRSKGRQYVINVNDDCQNDDNEDTFDSDLMDKTVLNSTQVLSNNSNIAVGIIQEGELHLVPVKRILQMRPQFNYLDKTDKRSKDESKTSKEGNEDFDEDEEAATPVKVTFASLKPDHLKKIVEQSFDYQAKKTSEEKWIKTNYLPPHHSQAELMRMEMFYTLGEEELNSLNLSPQQYMDAILPEVLEEVQPQKNFDMIMTSLSHIKKFPVLDQIKIIMRHVKIIPFSYLRAIVSKEHDTSTLLKYLQQMAVLVQGIWVVNSDLLYPKDSMSSQNAITGELMCRARDYILLLFTEQQFLNYKTISSVIKLPPAEIKEIFMGFATSVSKKGWTLNVSPCPEFCERYPEITQRQKMFWEGKRKYLREAMEAQTHPPPRQRRKSNREALGTENEEKNVGRGKKSIKDSSNDTAMEPGKHKKNSRSKKTSESTTS